LRDPYKSVDLEKLVQEHYGVTGYDPKTIVPTLSAKVNEQKTTANEDAKDNHTDDKNPENPPNTQNIQKSV
jgi:hypothetical protein